MKLTAAELAYVSSLGLCIAEKCDGCGKLLNQSVRYTITGKPGVYCSTGCRDFAFFGDRSKAKKQATPGRCAYCGGSLKGKKRGALYCDDACRMRYSRVRERTGTGRVEKPRTPAQSNHGLTDAKTA